MPITIKNRFTEQVIATVDDTDDLREAVIRLVKQGVDLSEADLYGANLAGAKLTRANLTRAKLTRANLAGAKLTRANLAGAKLTRANLTRADLTRANLDGAKLTRANLYGANLYGANLYGAKLTRANLDGANLYGANLYGANLYGANLYGANLYGANLTRANLYGANLDGANLTRAVEQYAKVPSLHRQILAAIESGGGFDMDSWHKCETTHCRAGWAIQLAGPAGKMLEACVGPSVAGALIHIASCPQLEGKVPDFHASNEDALTDIRRLAAMEPELIGANQDRGDR